jgi:hypothetical protein
VTAYLSAHIVTIWSGPWRLVAARSSSKDVASDAAAGGAL